MTLTKSDRTKLIEDMESVFVTKEEFAQALEENNNYLLSEVATKEDLIEFKSDILGAIQKLQQDDSAHKQLHNDLGQDMPKLKHQVKHLYEELNIPQPAY